MMQMYYKRYKCSVCNTLKNLKTLHKNHNMLNVRKIEVAMSDAKITKAGLCSRTKISRTTLDAILGGSDAKISTIENIAKALNISIGYLFDEELIGNSAIAHGHSVAAINSEISVGENVVILAERVKHLEELLAEKERLITVLMEKK